MTPAEREEMILSRWHQVECLAQRIYFRIGRRIPLEDLRQYGAVGLVKAADSYSPERGIKFCTYAEHKIRGAILDGIRRETQYRRKSVTPDMLSLDLDLYDPPDARAQHDYEVIDARLDVDKLMSSASLIGQELAHAYYYDGERQDSLAKQHGITQSGVSHLLQEAQRRMRAVA